MSQPSLEPPTPQHQLRFTRTWLREGYTVAAVDEFLHRAHHALESRDGSVSASDVRSVRFDPTRLKGGYDMGEVDEELDRLAAALEEIEPPVKW